MAARFLVTGGNGNWTSTTNWSATSGGASGASAPVAGDDVTFDTNSGAAGITTDTSNRSCASLTVTSGYTGTLTMTNTLTVTAGITLGANMTFAGVAAFIVAATQTLTSNGKIAPALTNNIGAGGTMTFADDWVITGSLTFSSANTQTVNGSTLRVGGSLTMPNLSTLHILGTTNIVMNGTGTISMSAMTTGSFRLNLEIDTSGTITLLGVLRYQTGIFKYTSGTVVADNSTLAFPATATLTVNASPLTLGALVLVSGGTMTLTVNGSSGFTMASLGWTGAAVSTYSFLSGTTYTITKSFVCLGQGINRSAIVSSTPSSPFFLNYTGNAMALANLNATDVDSSGGNPIYVYQGTLLRTTNWTAGTAIGTGGAGGLSRGRLL